MATPAIRALRKCIPVEDTIDMVLWDKPFSRVHEGNPYCTSVSYVSEAELKQRTEGLTRGQWNTFPGERVIELDTMAAYQWCVNNFNIPLNKFPHMAHGYAQQLGVIIGSVHYEVGDLNQRRVNQIDDDTWTKDLDLLYKYGADPTKKLAVCAALSTTCHSQDPNTPGLPPNKMVPEAIWQEVVAALSDEFSFVFVAAKNEKPLNIEGTWVLGEDIRTVANWLKQADVAVVVDTGIAHLAQAVDANIVSIYAAAGWGLATVDATKGKYACVNHTYQSPGPQGILTVTAQEIIDAILDVSPRAGNADSFPDTDLDTLDTSSPRD